MDNILKNGYKALENSFPKLTSIILPTFNSIQFLSERINSILNQTYQNWECIVVDGYSTDGSWEYIKEKTNSSCKFSYYQLPPKGPYNAWNFGIGKAKGDFIYIATSDDSMEHDCIEKLVFALSEAPECSLATCNLMITDSEGREIPGDQWEDYSMSYFLGDLINKKHIRIAPFDGLLCSRIHTPYTSITQFLARKKVFEEMGLFREDFGSIADFEWSVRVLSIYNNIFIPEKLATWRKHENQLTRHPKGISEQVNQYIAFCKMLDHAKEKIETLNPMFKKIRDVELKKYFHSQISSIILSKRTSARLVADTISKETIPLSTLLTTLVQKIFKKKERSDLATLKKEVDRLFSRFTQGKEYKII